MTFRKSRKPMKSTRTSSVSWFRSIGDNGINCQRPIKNSIILSTIITARESVLYQENLKQPYPEVSPLVLSNAENFQRGSHIYRIFLAASARDQAHPQFDGMTYLEYNETNEKADNAFIPPKLNRYDTRTNAGLARQKINTINSILTNFEFEPKITAFDEYDQPIDELGDILTDLVRKSRQIENYDEKRPQIYREMLRQGDVNVQERCVERVYKEKKLRTDYVDFSKLSTVKWSDGERIEKVLECHLVDGKKIFFGDIRQWDIRMQPYLFTVEYISRTDAESAYGYFERWSSVPYFVQKTMWTNDQTIFSDWQWAEVNQFKIEKIEFMDKVNDEYQLYLNGVPMLPAMERTDGTVSGFPLSVVSPSGEYPIAHGALQPLALFTYSKSYAAELKVDDAIATESKRISIIKFQQGAFPPAGNMGNKTLPLDLWMPSKIHQGVGAGDVEVLMKNPGLTEADFAFMKFIDDQMSKKSISDAVEGTPGGSQTTATQYLDMKRQQMTKLNTTFDAVINLEKQMTWLRLWSVLDHWPRPIDKKVDEARKQLVDVYRSVSVDTTFDDGTVGTRIISFEPNLYKTPEDVYAMEKESGYKFRYAFLDPLVLRNMKYNFRVDIVPTEKNSNDLDRMKFENDVKTAIAIAGPTGTVNWEGIKKRFAQKTGEKYDTFFTQNPQGGIMNPSPNGASPFGGKMSATDAIGAEPSKQLAANVSP